MKYRLLLAWVSMLCFGVAHAQDITIRFDGNKVKVLQDAKDSVKVEVDGAHVYVVSTFESHTLEVLLTGKSEDGQLVLKSEGRAKIRMKGLNLTSQEGAPLWLKNRKRVEITAEKGTENTLKVAACNDTANHKAAVIWAKDKIRLSGKGVLNVMATGDGCKGINCKDNITIEDLTLNVETRGNNLGVKENAFGGFGGLFGRGFPEMNDSTMQGGFGGLFGGGFGRFGERNDSTRQGRGFGGPFGGPRGDFAGPPQMGGFGGPFGGDFPEMNDSTMQGGFGGGPFAGFGGFGERSDTTDLGYTIPAGKNKYVGSTKGIKAQGKVMINSGRVTVVTHAAGAEGIEGKLGIELNGGEVNVRAVDDAINSGGRIYFNGANVVARSTNNDAVDSNYGGGFGMFFGGGGFGQQNQQDGAAIIITGGTVYAWSEVGMPEEGLDCDFAPIEITGGKVFTVGAGMGDMPSVPTNETAKQPTALIIGINIQKDEPVYIFDAQGKQIDAVTVPFSLGRSSSLITTPAFKVGETYTVKTKNNEKAFSLKENFTVVR